MPLFLKKMLSTVGTCSESISGSFYLYLFATEDKKRKGNLKIWHLLCFVYFPSFLLFLSFLHFFFVIEFKKNLSFHKFISPFAFLLKIVLKYIFWFCMRNNKGGNLRNDYFWPGKGGWGGGGRGAGLQNRVREVDFQDSH